MSLVKQLQQADWNAFQELYRQYHAKVYHFVVKHSNHSIQAEDLTHDIFLRLWEKRATLSAEVPLEAQLFVIARNVVINHYKREVLKQKVYNNLPIEKPDFNNPDDDLPSETITQLHTAIEALPPKRRQIFKMSKLDGLTYEEIAQTLAISKSTVESQMVKALKFLRERVTHLPFF
jgi:RNA polymerase sigma-70 factor (ECF subfamily)